MILSYKTRNTRLFFIIFLKIDWVFPVFMTMLRISYSSRLDKFFFAGIRKDELNKQRMTEIWNAHMEAMCNDFHDDDFPDEEKWLIFWRIPLSQKFWREVVDILIDTSEVSR